MACGKTFALLFVLLATQAFVSAEEAPEPFNIHNNPDQLDRHIDLSSFAQVFTDPFSQLLSTFSQFFPFSFSGLGNRSFLNNTSSFPPFPFPPSSQRSQEIAAGGLVDELGASPQDRFFFHSVSSNVEVGCNYTTQAGYSCAGCREQFLCSSNNIGRIRICPFYAPYCYNGVCGSTVNTTCSESTG